MPKFVYNYFAQFYWLLKFLRAIINFLVTLVCKNLNNLELGFHLRTKNTINYVFCARPEIHKTS